MKHLTFKQKVVQGIHDLFYIWIREFRTTFRDQGVLIFFVLVPLVYPLIYAFIYTNETIRDKHKEDEHTLIAKGSAEFPYPDIE